MESFQNKSPHVFSQTYGHNFMKLQQHLDLVWGFWGIRQGLNFVFMDHFSAIKLKRVWWFFSDVLLLKLLKFWVEQPKPPQCHHLICSHDVCYLKCWQNLTSKAHSPEKYSFNPINRLKCPKVLAIIPIIPCRLSLFLILAFTELSTGGMNHVLSAWFSGVLQTMEWLWKPFRLTNISDFVFCS